MTSVHKLLNGFAQTERDYIQFLKVAHNTMVKYEMYIANDPHVKVLMRSLESVMSVSSMLLHDANSILLSFETLTQEELFDRIAQIFTSNEYLLKMYGMYATSYAPAVASIVAYFKTKKAESIAPNTLKHLKEYLELPMSNFENRYIDFVYKVERQSPGVSPQSLSDAKLCLEGLYDYLRSCKEQQVNRAALVSHETSSKCKSPLLKFKRRFVKEGTLFKISKKGSLMKHAAYLFNDVLILVHVKKIGTGVESTLPLSSVSVEEADSYPGVNSGRSFILKSKQESFIAVFDNSWKRNEWMTCITTTRGELFASVYSEPQDFDLIRFNKSMLATAQVVKNTVAPVWIPDELQCSKCSRKFGVVRRRHHCRRCGACVCDKCSMGKVYLPNVESDRPVRVCINCETELMSGDRGSNHKIERTQQLAAIKKFVSSDSASTCASVKTLQSYSSEAILSQSMNQGTAEQKQHTRLRRFLQEEKAFLSTYIVGIERIVTPLLEQIDSKRCISADSAAILSRFTQLIFIHIQLYVSMKQLVDAEQYAPVSSVLWRVGKFVSLYESFSKDLQEEMMLTSDVAEIVQSIEEEQRTSIFTTLRLPLMRFREYVHQVSRIGLRDNHIVEVSQTLEESQSRMVAAFQRYERGNGDLHYLEHWFARDVTICKDGRRHVAEGYSKVSLASAKSEMNPEFSLYYYHIFNDVLILSYPEPFPLGYKPIHTIAIDDCSNPMQESGSAVLGFVVQSKFRVRMKLASNSEIKYIMSAFMSRPSRFSNKSKVLEPSVVSLDAAERQRRMRRSSSASSEGIMAKPTSTRQSVAGEDMQHFQSQLEESRRQSVLDLYHAKAQEVLRSSVACAAAPAPSAVPDPAVATTQSTVWEEYLTDDGNLYWYNPSTEEATFVNPNQTWTQFFDDDGTPFWYNKDTNVSTWDDPHATA